MSNLQGNNINKRLTRSQFSLLSTYMKEGAFVLLSLSYSNFELYDLWIIKSLSYQIVIITVNITIYHEAFWNTDEMPVIFDRRVRVH